MTVLPAIINRGGKAVFGSVKLPGGKLTGGGEVETRDPGEFGDYHAAGDNEAVLITVVIGLWTVQVKDGETRDFGPGMTLIVQDGGVPAAIAHRSKANGGTLILQKTKLTGLLEVETEEAAA